MNQNDSSTALLAVAVLAIAAGLMCSSRGCKATHSHGHDHNHHYDAQRHDHYIHFELPWKKDRKQQ